MEAELDVEDWTGMGRETGGWGANGSMAANALGESRDGMSHNPVGLSESTCPPTAVWFRRKYDGGGGYKALKSIWGEDHTRG